MAENMRVTAGSAQERQALTTLNASRHLADELDRLRSRYENADPGRRTIVEQDLFEASQRLCNLMVLNMHRMTEGLSTELADELEIGLANLRKRLLLVGVDLVVDRVGRVRDRARAVLDGAPHPIGLATRLREALTEFDSQLAVLGGNGLAAEQLAVLDEARRALAELAQREEEGHLAAISLDASQTRGGLRA